jgi:hypothetical protein
LREIIGLLLGESKVKYKKPGAISPHFIGWQHVLSVCNDHTTEQGAGVGGFGRNRGRHLRAASDMRCLDIMARATQCIGPQTLPLAGLCRTPFAGLLRVLAHAILIPVLELIRILAQPVLALHLVFILASEGILYTGSCFA